MFGDNEAYHNKFKTAARVRPRELQKLGVEFYELEHSNSGVTKGPADPAVRGAPS